MKKIKHLRQKFNNKNGNIESNTFYIFLLFI